MNRVLRWLFFAVFVRGVVLLLLGMNVRHRERLPTGGPAILAANHNSHLDTMVLISLMPRSLLPRVRPVAAADYFLRNRWLAWFSTRVIGIIPIKRQRTSPGEDLLAPVCQSLEHGEIVAFFPEGSRGEPERFKPLKSGIARLAERFPEMPIYPIYLHGLGKALPKGEALLVPFFLDVFVGEPLYWTGDRDSFLAAYRKSMDGLAAEGHFPPWE
jgi:1-acyl-sn-glycerol-3-phosphate acyltransferase